MMNKLLFPAFFFLICCFSFGQNSIKLDSLFKVLKVEKKDTNQVKTLMYISQEYYLRDAKKSLKFAEQELKISEELKWNKGIAMSYFRISSAYDNQGNFEKALEYRFKELEKWKELKNMKNVCKVLGNIGVSYSDKGNHVKAMEYYILSLKLSEEIENNEQTINNLCNIASLYNEQGDSKKALEYYSKSLKLAEKYGYKNNIAINQGNMGNIYSSQANYKKALECYLIALKIDEQLGNIRNVSGWIANIGALYQLQGDSANAAGNTTLLRNKSSQALKYYFKALKYTEDLGNEYLQAYTLGNIGEIYTTLKQFKEAEEYLHNSLELAKKISSVEVMTDAHQRLYYLYKKTNIPIKSLENYEKYISLRDSIYNVDNKKTISELQIKYETEKKEAENKSLVQENKLQTLRISNSRYLTIGLIGFLVIMLVLGILTIRQNKIKAQQIATQFEQRLLRAQMNPHFIFNSLASIESFIYDHQPKEAGVYLSSFSRLMRLILENSTLEYITLEKEIECLNYYLSLQKLRLDDNLSYTIELDKNTNPCQIYLPPMLTQPFIENAIEHGFRGSRKQGDIKVSFNLVTNNLQVQIIDNGIGIDKAQQQKDLHKSHKSLAMQITMERLAFLNKSRRKKLSFTYTDMANEQTGQSGTKIIFLIPQLNN